jgi:hypothetical protein
MPSSTSLRDTKKGKSTGMLLKSDLPSYFGRKPASPSSAKLSLESKNLPTRKNLSTISINDADEESSKRKRKCSLVKSPLNEKLSLKGDKSNTAYQIMSNNASRIKKLSTQSKNGFQSAWMMALSISDSTVSIDAADKENKTNIYKRKSQYDLKNSVRPTMLSTNLLKNSKRAKNCTIELDSSSQQRQGKLSVFQSSLGVRDEPKQNTSHDRDISSDTKNEVLLPESFANVAIESDRIIMKNDTGCQRISKNIVHHIVNRAIYGTTSNKGRYQNNTTLSSSKSSYSMVLPSIYSNCGVKGRIPKIVPWLELVSQERNEPTVCTFCCWDDIGVLLAAVFGHTTIRIYDWDTALAANILGRNHYLRQEHTTSQQPETKSRCAVMSITPIVTLDMRQIIPNSCGNINLITFVQWNPLDQDEIIIGSRSTSKIYIINLNDANSWKESSQNSNGSKRQLQYQEICCSGLKLSKQSKLVFVESGRYALLTTESSLTCFQFEVLSTKQQQQSKLVWSFKPWQQQTSNSITSLTLISTEIVLVGSSQGHMALINWKNMQRTSSFTNDQSPTLIDKWISYKGLSSIHDIPTDMMGICHLQEHMHQQKCINML